MQYILAAIFVENPSTAFTAANTMNALRITYMHLLDNLMCW